LCATGAFGAEEKALPTGEEILKGMVEREAKVKTMEYDSKGRIITPKGTVMFERHTVAAKIGEYGKTVEKFLVTEGSTMDADGETYKFERKQLCDGEFEWGEMRLNKQPLRSVYKTKAHGWDGLSWAPVMSKGIAENLKTGEALGAKGAVLSKVGEEVIEGKKMYVFEVTAGRGQQETFAAMMAKVKLYVSEEEMTLRRVVMYGAKGLETSRTDFLEVELDGKVDAELFVYEVPEGVKVEDMTGEGEK